MRESIGSESEVIHNGCRSMPEGHGKCLCVAEHSAIGFMREFTPMGGQFALDDFGNGLSSFA